MFLYLAFLHSSKYWSFPSKQVWCRLFQFGFGLTCRVYLLRLASVTVRVGAVFAPTIFHMLCLTNTAIRRGPLKVVLWEWKGAQSRPWGALTAWGFWLLQPAVIATLQWPLMRVLRLTHNRKRHSTKRLQEKRFWMSLR